MNCVVHRPGLHKAYVNRTGTKSDKFSSGKGSRLHKANVTQMSILYLSG